MIPEKSFLLTVAALVLLLGSVRATEPPTLRDVAEPPMLKFCECDVCECEACDGACTVPVLATLPYDADHTCNKCGNFANVVETEFADGTHSHRCGKCGHVWYHGDPGVSIGAPVYVAAPANPFALPGCANGNCPPSIRYAAPSASRTYAATTSRSVSSSTRTGPVRRILGFVFRGRLSRGCR